MTHPLDQGRAKVERTVEQADPLRDFRLEVRPVRDCEITNVVYAPGGVPLEHGVELARVEGRTTGPEPEIEGKATLSGYVAFSDGSGVMETLDGIRAAVRKALDSFQGGAPRRPHHARPPRRRARPSANQRDTPRGVGRPLADQM